MNNKQNKPLAPITLIQVENNQEKLQVVQQITHYCYSNQEKLLILTPNTAASQFIDTFLWKEPKESFLPHSILTQEADHPIGITENLKNWNHASILLNLTFETAPMHSQFLKIFELYDSVSEENSTRSQHRISFYQEHNYPFVTVPYQKIHKVLL